MSALEALARACETAEGPSFVLDRRIAVAFGWPSDKLPPAFSASIDAALGLKPQDWYWKVGFSSIQPGWGYVYATHQDHNDSFSGLARTPALALCAACIRALDKGVK